MAEELERTKADPLSEATRAMKRNLLVAALIAVAFKAFNVEAEKIPISGFEITFTRGVFEFLLLAFLGWSFLSFALYYYIDIKNFPLLAHQLQNDKWRRDHKSFFIISYRERIKVMLTRYKFKADVVSTTNEYETTLSKWADGVPSTFRLWMRMFRAPMNYDNAARMISATAPPGLPIVFVHRKPDPGEQEVLNVAAQILRRKTLFFPLEYAWSNARMLPRFLTVRMIYLLRNYGIDGILPLSFGVFALGALLNLYDIRFLMQLVPKE